MTHFFKQYAKYNLLTDEDKSDHIDWIEMNSKNVECIKFKFFFFF